MARKLTQTDINHILVNIISECKDCKSCKDCKNVNLENLVKEMEEIKNSNSLNFLGTEFIDFQLTRLQKALCTGSSLQRENLIKECIQNISSSKNTSKQIKNQNKNQKQIKKSFLQKLFG